MKGAVLGKDRFTVFVDRAGGVDHALCERVTTMLRSYLDTYSVNVSSPGFERPLRTEEKIGGRTRFRGEVLGADERKLKLSVTTGASLDIPYDAIVRGNLIDEG